MFIWGWSTKSIGNYLTNLPCSHCQYPNLALGAFQKFFDVFFIPTIPLGKEHFFICPKCETQFKVNENDLNSLPKVKTPWWGFSGMLIIGALIILGSTLKAFETPKEKINPENIAVNDIAIIKNNDDPDYPYSLIKVTEKMEGKLIFTPGKYAYPTSYQAEKATWKTRQNSFSEDSYETSIEDFKKLDITHIERPN